MVCEVTQAIILVWATQGPTSSREDEAYITYIVVHVVGVYKHSGRGEVPKFLEIIEANANI
jgi:nicotinamide riboside transporter PnuC